MSIQLPARLPRKQTEGDLTMAILRAVNATGYARIWRNNTGKLPDANGRIVQFGLAEGSADLIGLVRCDGEIDGFTMTIGRFLAIEVKLPGRLNTLTDNQARWLQVTSDFGGAATVATSVDEALAYVKAIHEGRT